MHYLYVFYPGLPTWESWPLKFDYTKHDYRKTCMHAYNIESLCWLKKFLIKQQRGCMQEYCMHHIFGEVMNA
jgi:hypothetical protein